MIECGPRPGLLVRSSASRLIGTPGCNSFMKCDQVFGKLTNSPDSIVRIGGRVASKTPRRTVSWVDSTTWTRPSPVAAAPAGAFAASAACASLANRGPTAASAAMKLLARSNWRRRRPRAVKKPSSRSWSISSICSRRSAARLSKAASLMSSRSTPVPFSSPQPKRLPQSWLCTGLRLSLWSSCWCVKATPC